MDYCNSHCYSGGNLPRGSNLKVINITGVNRSQVLKVINIKGADSNSDRISNAALTRKLQLLSQCIQTENVQVSKKKNQNLL